MEKHVFRMVSRGSSNIIAYIGWSEEKMRKSMLVLVAMMFASLLVGVAYAQPTLSASPLVVKPGDTITISGTASSDSIILVQVSNSRTIIEEFNITSDLGGVYSIEYLIPVGSPVDIYTINIQDAGQTFQTSIVVSRMTQQQLVNTLRLMVTNAKKQAETALIEARKQGKTLPEDIKQKYAQGLEELANAVNAIQSQNYVSAQESLKEAMNLFREIVAYTYGEDIEAPVDTDQLRNRVQEMINQLTRQYNEINAVVQRLKQHGLNVDALEREMSLLRNRIGEAQSLLDQGKVNEAQQSAMRTQQLVQQRLAELRQKQAEITKRLVSKYQVSLENRVAAYIDTFNKIQSVRPVQSALALQELEALQVRLVYSGELIDENNIPSALREMYATEYRLRRLAVTVNGDVTIRLLNRIDELTANLQDSTGTAANQIETEIENTKDSLSDYLRDRRPISPSNSPSPTGP